MVGSWRGCYERWIVVDIQGGELSDAGFGSTTSMTTMRVMMLRVGGR
jgi:hypothetical protein